MKDFLKKRMDFRNETKEKCDVWCEKFEKRWIPKNPKIINLNWGNDDKKGNFWKFSQNFFIKIHGFQRKIM